MNESNNFNFDILSILLAELKRQGKENLSIEELTKEYNDFVIIYQQFQQLSIEASQYGIDASKVWSKNTSGTEAVIQLQKLIAKEKEHTTLIKLEQEIEQKLELLLKTTNKTVYVQNLGMIDLDYMILKTAKITRAEKINKLRELLDRINQCSSKLQNIEIPLQLAVQKIKEIEELLSSNEIALLIYDSKKEVRRLQNELTTTLNNSNDNNISEKLSDFVKSLNKFKIQVEQLSSFSKYQKNSSYEYTNNGYTYYEIFGIGISINTQNKRCILGTSHMHTETLRKCRIIQIVTFLTQKIRLLKTDEFIKATIIGEKAMSEYINNQKLPLQDIFRVGIDNFLRSLGVNAELKRQIPIEQISELSNDTELQELLSFIKMLEEQGFEIKMLNDIGLSLTKTISQQYQSLDLESIGKTDIYQILSEIIINTHPIEQYIFSTLQIVYNCIDRNLLKKMHQELNHNASIESSPHMQRVVDIITRYAKKDNGEKYTEEEIVTFLKNKNIAINSDYRFQDLPSEEYALSDDEEYIEMSDTYRTISKITGRRH